MDEARLKRVEARDSITECIHLYALAGDRRNDREILKTIFTTDAIYELVGMGRFEGLNAILDGLADIAKKAVLWSVHMPAGPLIKLSPKMDAADVFWWVWCPTRLQNDDGSTSSYWAVVHYNGEMVEDNGAWKFRRLLFEARFRTPFEGPWTETEGPFRWPEWAATLRSDSRS